MKNIVGHHKQQEFFQTVQEQNTVFHAYCFVGPEHVGKRHVAYQFAAELLSCTPKQLMTHPDVMLVHRQKDKKTNKTKKHIDVDQLRELKHRLTQFSAMGGYKVAIIDNAHLMNTQAANALLKTLEEPGKQTCIMLVTHDEAALPKTILSRCQQIHFGFVPKNDILLLPVVAKLPQAEQEDIAALAKGRAGLAHSYANDAEAYESFKALIAGFHALKGKPLYQKFKQVEPLFGDKTDHIATREDLIDTLSVWMELLRDDLQGKGDLPPAQAVHVIDSLIQAKRLLTKNIHPRLLVEQVLLALP
jgi:hypothetical protein